MTYYFNEKIGLGAEVNWFGVRQKYSGDNSGGSGASTFDVKDRIRYMEIPILFKLKSEGGFYFELGPKFGIRGKCNEDYTNSPTSVNNYDYEKVDISGGLKKSVISLVFGFGGRFDLIEDKLAMTAGLRFAGALTDATVEYNLGSATSHIDANEAVYGDLGYVGAYAHIPQTGSAFDAAGNATHYEKTTLVSGGIQIGISWNFGSK